MKFTLEIELGNDAMQTAEDVAEAIRSKLKGIEASTFNVPEGPYNIRDRNGNTVGKWEVKRDLSAALDAVADQRWADAHEPDAPSAAPTRSASAFIAECDRRKAQGNPPPAPDDSFWKK